MFCYDEYSIGVYESLRLGIFTPEIPSIIYYSHITAIVVTLLLGVFVYSKSKTLPAKILLAISLAFSTLAVSDILLWTQLNAGTVMFLWSFWLTLFTLIFGLSFYFLYAFIKKKDLAFRYKLAFALILVLIEALSVTTLNLQYFDLAYCEAVEGLWMLNAVFGLSFIILISSIYFGLRESRRATDPEEKRTALLATVGVGSFLFVFSAATYLASIISIFFAEGHYVFLTEQYGYFGMTVFIGVLAYTIVRYQAFKINAVAANILVVTLGLLVASQFLFVRSQPNLILTAVTLVLVASAGYLLIQSVRREIEQRRRIEELAKRLEKANKRLKILDKMKSEFVSIASHQLRSPLTSIRGYSSMLLEGSYGKLPKKSVEAIERIQDSARYMALSVEDYLNVSRIESGNMKYEMSEVNFKELAEKVVDEVRPAALKKGLLIVFRSDCDGSCSARADIGKIRQVLHNLIDNAMKYTPKGSITVVAHDDVKKKKACITVKDTGVGMSKETLEDVFNKFVRAKNANEINVTGTGLGLFVAKKMVEEMGGTIAAESDGEGKGSTFHVEFPLLSGQPR